MTRLKIDRWIRSLALYNLSAEPLPDDTFSEGEFQQLLKRTGEERLLGALAEAVADEALVLADDQVELLIEHHVDWLGHALRIERLLFTIAEVLASAMVDFRVVKGVALANVVYRDPSWRLYADLDVLIPSAQFDRAVHCLTQELGGVQEIPELRPGFDREFGKEAMLRIGRLEADLHRTFVTGPFGLTIDLDDLFTRSTPFTVGGVEVLALDPLGRLMHAMYNLALGDWPIRWGSVRDLLHCSADVDGSDDIVDVARRWRATAVIQRAAMLATDIAGLGDEHLLAELSALPVPRAQEWLLRSYLTPARSYSRPLASLAVIPGVRPRLRYARAIVHPGAAYLRSRGWTQRSHRTRALRRMFGVRRG